MFWCFKCFKYVLINYINTVFTVSSLSCMGAGIAQWVQRLVTCWIVRGSSPGGGKIFRTSPNRPWGPPSFLYNGYQIFPGVKAAGTWYWTPIPSSAEAKRKWSFTPSPLWGFGSVTGYLYLIVYAVCRSQWPRGLRRRSVAARLLRLWVLISPGDMVVCLLWVLCFVR
jgi:hypothetical protein